MLPRPLMAQVAPGVQAACSLADAAVEWTIEANPATIDSRLLPYASGCAASTA